MGFDGAPRSFGSDTRGREVFSFLEGEVPCNLDYFSDQVFRGAAALIRRFHDLSTQLVECTAASAVGIETVCLNDLSPCNFVFRDGLPMAMIDFDAASPGTRAYALGYAAWLWLDIGNSEVTSTEQKQRLHLFVDAYGALTPQVVVPSMMHRQSVLAEGQRLARKEAAACLAWTRHHVRTLAG